MRQRTCASLLILAGVLLAAPAHAQDCQSPTGRHVRVAGSAVVRLPPDRVSFSAGVETLHANVSQAFRMNAQKVEAVLAALKAKGVEPKELQTSDARGLVTQPGWHVSARGYRVANRVIVTREKAADVGDLIEAAIAAGSNDVGQLVVLRRRPGRRPGARPGAGVRRPPRPRPRRWRSSPVSRSARPCACRRAAAATADDERSAQLRRRRPLRSRPAPKRSPSRSTSSSRSNSAPRPSVIRLRPAAARSATRRSGWRGGARRCRRPAARRSAAGCRGPSRPGCPAPGGRS